MPSPAYLRFPSLHADRVAFVAEDDVWLADTAGGRAFRLTADRAPVAHTRLSPDGTRVAYTSRRDGAPEVHVVESDGGTPRRLTYFGSDFTRVLGWTAEGRVLAATAAGEPFRSRTWAYAVPVDGGSPQRRPYGPVSAIAEGGPGGAVVLGVAGNRRGAASWKRYRGGTAGKFWLDPTGSGQFAPFLDRINGQLEDPYWIGDRLAFVSDHEGCGNVYSCRVDGGDLRRHSDHEQFYARYAHSDGTRLVYQCGGELWLLEEIAPDSQPTRLPVVLGGARTSLARHPVTAADHLGELVPDHTGRASLLEVRGSVQWVAHRDGPAEQVGAADGVRQRLPRLLGPRGEDGQRAVWVTDADGDDALEVGPVDGSAPSRRFAGGEVGRVLDLAAAPDGSVLAVATHDGRVLLVDTDTAAVREVDRAGAGDASGLAFSPDSAWLAWSHPGPEPLRQIRLAAVAGGPVVEATPLRFTDTEPVFTLDGRHLAFLSVRTLDPVYDAFVFDMSFVGGTRPYLLPLGARTPSPFDPSARGRAMPGAEDRSGPADKAGPDAPADQSGRDTDAPRPPTVTLDREGLAERLVPVPVPSGQYSQLRAAQGGLLWLQDPLVGELGDGLPRPDAKPRSAVQRFDFQTLRSSTLLDKADRIAVSGDGRWLVVIEGSTVTVVPADRKAPEGEDGDDSRVEVDLARIRLEIDPMAEWVQMYGEAGRLMRDHFWIEDMGGVDWDEVLERYRPVLARVATRDDLSELIWEVQGELGASHAYETPPARPVEQSRRLGLLGADLVRDGDVWRVDRVVPGESSAPAARSPLAAPGVDVRAGDALLSVGGRPVDPATGPAALLVGAAETPVTLGILGADGERRQVVVVPLANEMALRYQNWVTGRRAAVHEATGGRTGYLHIPDMVASGWAQFHRDIRVELGRECLIVDVRDNNGGHVSSLVIEKLARVVHAWAVVRHGTTEIYPEGARRGPMVAITNEHAGSDGDIVTAMIRKLGLAPVIGQRTWGGVIGIDGRYSLVDGTEVTQPRYSFWFGDRGWEVENYGVDPDIEVRYPPQDWAAGTDPQLDAAITLVLERLAEQPANRPPSTGDRPDRAAPPLPPRP